jgi:hypothetical protein
MKYTITESWWKKNVVSHRGHVHASSGKLSPSATPIATTDPLCEAKLLFNTLMHKKLLKLGPYNYKGLYTPIIHLKVCNKYSEYSEFVVKLVTLHEVD